MSSWCALNVSYRDTTKADDVNTWLSKVTAYENPSNDFDVMLSVFTHGEDDGEVISYLIELAEGAGDVDMVVSVHGNDTSDIFTVNLHDGNSAIKTWSGDINGFRPLDPDNERVPLMVQVENDLGLRPEPGGNYTNPQ